MLALKLIGYVLLGLLALLVLLLVVPVRLRVRYDTALAATLWVLFVPIRLLPKNETQNTEQQADKPQPKAEKPKPKKKSLKETLKESLSFEQHAADLKRNGVVAAALWLKEIADRVLTATDRVLNAVTVTRLFARADIAQDDAAQTALTYGRVCATVFPALGLIESKLTVKRQDVQITPAFCAEQTRFCFDTRLRVCVWRVLAALLCLAVSYIRMPTVGEIKRQRYQNDKEAV